MEIDVRILESAEDMGPVEDLQRTVWPESEVDIVPTHLLMTVALNGGVVLGAYVNARLVGFTFGFLGVVATPDGPRVKHCSHMMGVDPNFRDYGVGYALKRAQWQFVRYQEIDLITWTYDPLQSRNANFNISKLGSICNTYKRNYYGTMRDGLNVGVPSDRFMVEWWVNSPRVKKRMGSNPRRKLDLAHYLEANAEVCNPTSIRNDGLPVPPSLTPPYPWDVERGDPPLMVLLEIPADYDDIKVKDIKLASEWRSHTRTLFEALFTHGYLTTDFVYLSGATPRSFYVLSHGDSTLGA